MNKLLHMVWLACLILGACSGAEVLQPRDGTVPAGTDLSGNWLMREIAPADRRRFTEAIQKARGAADDVTTLPQQSAQTRNRSSRSMQKGLVYVFLESGKALKVTQTPHALFISFDRSVVEEYRFGESRLVSVGQVQAQRVTGWDGTQLVVETLDKDGMKLTERFQLTNNGESMQRQITFRNKKLEQETIVQNFDRAD